MSLRAAAAATVAGAMRIVGEAPFLALGHRFPHTLVGRASIAEALFRHGARRAGDAPAFARLRNGLRMSVPMSREGASVRLAGCLMGDDEERIHAMYCRFLRPGDVFFDVGSHLGFYSLTAAGLTGPDGPIHSFDAQAWVIPHLQRSVEANALRGRMQVNHNAVVARDGETVTIYPSRAGVNTGAASIMGHGWVDTAGGTAIAGVSLDAYVQRRGIDRIDAMKIDVEGAEFGVLQGMTTIFATMPPRLLMIELMIGDDGLDAAAAAGARDALSLMRDAGYEIRDIQPDGRLGRTVVYDDLKDRIIANLGFARPELRAARPDMFA